MITTMHIKNIGIIDELTVNFKEGFNVLTGETGAGKTLIIDSLNIICGARFSKEMIRKGEEYSLVEACLYLPKNELSEDGNIIVTREVYENGRNLCKINGRLVTVSELREFMKYHIDIHGQFDNQVIMDEENHIIYLDDYSKKDIGKIKEEYMLKYNEYMILKQKLKENFGDEKERQRTLDLLNYELNEIDDASLVIGEEEILKRRLDIIKNKEKINDICNVSNEKINDNIIFNLEDVIKDFSKLSILDEKYSNILNDLNEAYYNLIDVSHSIKDELDSIEFDERETHESLKRMDLICSLKRKYGADIQEILDYRQNVSEKIKDIQSYEENNRKINEKISLLQKDMKNLALSMNNIRKEKALKLADKINKNLELLEMNSAQVKIEVTLDMNDKFNLNGLDNVKFLICTNKGEDFKSLSKVASGGEISRIVLAIKSTIAEIDQVETCIFDEIDTGISGRAAKAVGAKIRDISKYHQVICVTHLAPVAASADYHYYIYKEVENLKTKTNIQLLNSDESINELARISCGDVTEASLKYAVELKNLELAV